MSRQPLFDLEEGSMELDSNAVMDGGLSSIAEEDGQSQAPASYVLSNAEQKEFTRRKKQGKLKQKAFGAENVDNDEDVIPAGAHIKTTREHDELTVVIRNLSDKDYEHLKNIRLRNWETGNLLSDPIQRTAKRRFENGPTTIQSYIIPLIMKANKDIFGRAQTGSGKSAAYLFPIIEKIHQKKRVDIAFEQSRVNSQEPYAVVFLPTRELCLQVFKEARRLVHGTNVKVAVSFGGIDMGDTYRMMRQGADIVIGTPSRINHLFFGIEQNDFHKACFDLTNLEYLVLDEADRLIDLAEFCTYATPFKKRLEGKKHYTYIFSATDTDCQSGKALFVNNPIEVIVGGDEGPVSSIVQAFIEVDSTKANAIRYKKHFLNCIPTKIDILLFLLERSVIQVIDGFKRVSPVVVFVSTRRQSDSIAIFLLRNGFRAMSSNSDRSMACRMDAVRGVQSTDMKSRKYDVIVATDVFARGLNVPDLQTVINFSLPLSCPINYIHRIGRTGRMGNVGRAISFFDPFTDSDIAPFLEKCLINNGQEVPEFLGKVSYDVTKQIEIKAKNRQQDNEHREGGNPIIKSVLDSDITF